ncbi:hypothetical protein AgCh_009900 [Apium graveolens]
MAVPSSLRRVQAQNGGIIFKTSQLRVNSVSQLNESGKSARFKAATRKGAYDLTSITTVVNGRSILLDHIELGKALKLSDKVLNLANIDTPKEFIFIKSEYKLYLSVLCGIEISHDMENIFSNTSSDKLMRFPEIKLMYKLDSHKLPNFQVSSTISDRSKRTIFPMDGFGELHAIDLDPIVSTTFTTLAPFMPSSQVNFEKEFAKLKEADEELDAIFQSLQDAYKKVIEKVQVTEAKVGALVDVLSNTVSRVEASPVIGVVNDEPVVNGENAMETDLVDNAIINNPAYETID